MGEGPGRRVQVPAARLDRGVASEGPDREDPAPVRRGAGRHRRLVSATPRWRQAYDAVDQTVTPRAESFVRTPAFARGAALVQRGQKLARDTARGVTARAWHLV